MQSVDRADRQIPQVVGSMICDRRRSAVMVAEQAELDPMLAVAGIAELR